MKRLLALLVAAALSGCLGPPEVPDDAVRTTDPDLPGLVLHSWLEEGDGRVRLHAVAENQGDSSFDIRDGCGHPWNVTLLSPAGQPVPFRQVEEPPGCAAFWEKLRPNQHKDVLYSWDYALHDIENATSEPAPAGNYTWAVTFELRDDVHALRVEHPVAVSS